MENKIYRFDELFLLEQIKKSKERLKNDNLSQEEKNDIKAMIIKFSKYLIQGNSKTKKCLRKKETKEEMCKNLEEKLNSDLTRLSIDFWCKIKYLCNNLNCSQFEEIVYNNIPVNDTQMLNLILDFYKNLDISYYKKALQIIQSPISLINFDDNSNLDDECFECYYLNAPFLNIKTAGDEKYCTFVHELQHGIEFLLDEQNYFSLYRELSPIFFEIIFTDILYNIYQCEGMYSVRINNNVFIMESLKEYIDMLLLFKAQGRKVNKNNIEILFGTNGKKRLEEKYKIIMKVDFVEYCRYFISLLKSIELREKYYKCNRQQVIQELRECVSGNNLNVKYNSLIKCYNDFIDEIEEKHKDKQKTVKL